MRGQKKKEERRGRGHKEELEGEGKKENVGGSWELGKNRRENNEEGKKRDNGKK